MTDTRFLSAGIHVVATINGSQYDISDFAASNALGALPRASLKLPLGKPSGGDSGKEQNPSAGSIGRFDTVEVSLTVYSTDSNGDTFSALPAGVYKIFSGVVDSVTVVRSPRSVDLAVECLHKRATLTAGSSLFSPFLPTDLIDMSIIYTGLVVQSKTMVLNIGVDFWDTVADGIQSVFNGVKQLGPTVAATKRWISDNDLEGIQAESAKAVESLKVVSVVDGSLLTLAIKPENIRKSITSVFTGSVLNAIKSRPNLWSILVSIASDFGFSLVADADKINAIPYYPFVNKTACKKLRLGDVLYAKRTTADPSETDMLSVVGTLVTAGEKGFLVKKEEGGEYFTGVAYKIPGAEDAVGKGATLQLLRSPPWLLPNSSSPTVKLNTPESKPEEVTGDPAADDRSQEAMYQFARMQTLRRVFGKGSLEITTPLRFDIVPGQCLEVPFIDTDSNTITMYGFVESVSTTISPGASSSGGAVSTSIRLSYPRTEAEHNKYVVDGPGNLHFCWALDSFSAAWKNHVWAGAQ